MMRFLNRFTRVLRSPGEPSTARLDSGGEAYGASIAREIDRYAHVENVHDLPPIFHYWSNKYVRPKFEAFGLSRPTDIFFKYCHAVCVRDLSVKRQFVSLGSGNCDIECELVEGLLRAGVRNFAIECLELNPFMLERGAEQARRRHILDFARFVEADVNAWVPDRPYDVVLANQSLHHFVHLERIFASVRQALSDDGFFLADEMIGRNGHMRWPEALAIINEIWDKRPERYKYNHLLKRAEPVYDNWDCSKEGFEGVRSQDILPLLLNTFEFEFFLAFGNIIDVFVDRCFGHNYDPANPVDTDFIDAIQTLDERCIEAGAIKPTHMTAAMCVRQAGSPKVWKHLTPAFCARQPDAQEPATASP